MGKHKLNETNGVHQVTKVLCVAFLAKPQSIDSTHASSKKHEEEDPGCLPDETKIKNDKNNKKKIVLRIS